MRLTLIFLILLGLNLNADYVKKTTAVCDNENTLLELADYQKTIVSKDTLELEMWLMGHDCKIIDNKTKIQVLDYTGKITGILKIKLKKDNSIVYGLGRAIQIEQPGQKNIIYKF